MQIKVAPKAEDDIERLGREAGKRHAAPASPASEARLDLVEASMALPSR
jgi:hypothetical protein